jgi:hypothetical protein
MKKNVGKYDRALRLVLAVVVFVLAYVHVLPGSWNIITWCVAGILLVTAAFGRCPLYGICSIDTHGANKSSTSGASGPSGANSPAHPKVS